MLELHGEKWRNQTLRSVSTFRLGVDCYKWLYDCLNLGALGKLKNIKVNKIIKCFKLQTNVHILLRSHLMAGHPVNEICRGCPRQTHDLLKLVNILKCLVKGFVTISTVSMLKLAFILLLHNRMPWGYSI